MHDNLKAYFVENVWMLYEKYIESRNSNQSGFNSHLNCTIDLCIRLFHIREHFPEKYIKTNKECTNNCKDYKLLGNVVNAYKHSQISNNNPLISNSKNIYEQIIITEYEDELGPYKHILITVSVKLDDGTTKDLHDIILNVLNMWLSEFKNIGILNIPPIEKTDFNQISPRDEKSDVLDFKAMQNLKFGPKSLKFQKYNYEKRMTEPVDLTGVKIEMNIYAPTTYTLNIKIEKNGSRQEFPVEINEDQLNFFNSLKSEQERIKYIFKIAKEQKTIA